MGGLVYCRWRKDVELNPLLARGGTGIVQWDAVMKPGAEWALKPGGEGGPGPGPPYHLGR